MITWCSDLMFFHRHQLALLSDGIFFLMRFQWCPRKHCIRACAHGTKSSGKYLRLHPNNFCSPKCCYYASQTRRTVGYLAIHFTDEHNCNKCTELHLISNWRVFLRASGFRFASSTTIQFMQHTWRTSQHCTRKQMCETLMRTVRVHMKYTFDYTLHMNLHN